MKNGTVEKLKTKINLLILLLEQKSGVYDDDVRGVYRIMETK